MATAAIELPARDGDEDRRPVVLSAAELAECTCPDSCERDHDRD